MQFLHFKKSFTLDETYYLDNNQTVDLTRILKDALMTSSEHDKVIHEHLGRSFIGESQTWVITQYQINWTSKFQEKEHFEIETSIIDVNRFFVTRRFRVTQQKQAISEIYTQFAAIDFGTRKMVRLNVDLAQENGLIESYSFTGFETPKRVRELEYSQTTYEIKESDYDKNQHVNNLVYLRWGFEALKLDNLGDYASYQVHVKYANELRDQEIIAVESHVEQVHEGLEVNIVILTLEESKDVCFIKLLMK